MVRVHNMTWRVHMISAYVANAFVHKVAAAKSTAHRISNVMNTPSFAIRFACRRFQDRSECVCGAVLESP